MASTGACPFIIIGSGGRVDTLFPPIFGPFRQEALCADRERLDSSAVYDVIMSSGDLARAQ